MNAINLQTRSHSTKSPLEILHIAYASEILANYFHRLPLCLPVGLCEQEIESHVVKYLMNYQSSPALKGYREYPASICVSRNHIVAHGVPSEEILKKGDLITIDIVSKYQDWYADMSWTYGVGALDINEKYLLGASWEISRAGCMAAKVGNSLRDIGKAVQKKAKELNVYVYCEFVGHGIGKEIHEYPLVQYNFNAPTSPITSGMVLCIEPIVSLYPQKVMKLPNGAYIGIKKEKTAVYEHMVAVYEQESKVLSYNMCEVDDLPASHPSL